MVKWGGFIPPGDFDPLVHGTPPNALAAIEPVQLLSLEVARRALEDAGYADREFDRARTSVVFGAQSGCDLSGGYTFRALYPMYVAEEMPEALDRALPEVTEDTFPGIIVNVIAGRIANRLDLGETHREGSVSLLPFKFRMSLLSILEPPGGVRFDISDNIGNS